MGVLYLAALAYLALHLAAYFVYLRHLPSFRQEATIFRYHALSSCIFSAAALLPGLIGVDARLLVAGLGLVMLHGLYSITFLELWSISQIGYSIVILAEVERHGTATAEALVRDLARIGEAKKAGRLQSLGALGLVRLEGGRYRLTGRGRILAGAIGTLRWLANYADTG
jgi:hypothetical protein